MTLRQSILISIEISLLLKPLIVKLQRPPIFCDDPYYVIWSAVGNVGFNLQGDPHIGTNKSDKVGDNLICDLAGVPPDPHRIKGDGPVVPLRLLGLRFLARFIPLGRSAITCRLTF